ncbi:CHASE4 domain-containing protein [Methanosarcina sp. UBA5]|uniref:sensor histidine kinase n=1 Tax=Methanosarcina sp. UBA5 TaxID=1915593 RepID=UPI0025E702CF|nr:CHASE4 domain-containing protein [Methanosarcina sp. UBA5]
MSGIDIGKKVLLITLLIFGVLAAAFTLTHTMQLSNFLSLEEKYTRNNVERVQNAISTEQGYLDYIAQDWACWNETYKFVEDRNQMFIQENIQNHTLAELKINVMLFVNNSGSLVYAKSVDVNTARETPVPEDLLRLVKDGTLLTKGENGNISGFVLLDGKPMFISCHSILTTNYTGPVKGTVIFGKYFDDNLLESFKEATRSSLLMYSVDDDLPPDFQDKLNNFSHSPQRTIVEPLNDSRIAGYFELLDISGKPALVMRADFPREVYWNGERTLNNMYFFLLLIGFMTVVGVKFALDKLFISRLIEIDNFVTRVRSEKDLSRRLCLKDNDELYRLSREINEMLNEIYLADQELKTQEREKKVLLDSLNELAIFANPQQNIIWANKAALEFLEMDLQKAVGLCLKNNPSISGPLSDSLDLKQIFVTGNRKSREFTGKDGRVWFVQAIPVTEEDGKIIGVLETCRDVTERKTAEILLQEKQIAEAANRTKSEFLANMSHELRTPLNSIIGFSDLLYEQVYGELNEKQLKSVGNISKSGKHLLNLINGILDLSKVEAGKMELSYKQFELVSKLSIIKNLLSPLADRKNVQIEINIDSSLGSICADEARFAQIMYNLVDNAIKFSSENGLVKIGARKKGGMVEITVMDTGIGIKPEDQSKLFKPFSQVDSFLSKQFQGTGLGLSLVKQIVRLHGGYVWFRSNPGEGSTFAFAIPITGNKSHGETTD